MQSSEYGGLNRVLMIEYGDLSRAYLVPHRPTARVLRADGQLYLIETEYLPGTQELSGSAHAQTVDLTS